LKRVSYKQKTVKNNAWWVSLPLRHFKQKNA